MAVADDLPELTVADAAAWREWLGEHHQDPSGVWLLLAKKGTTDPTSLSYDQALDEALCWGWIDGQAKRRDDATYLQRLTPRRLTSQWSQRNVGIIARLDADGRMQPAGWSEVERAKADGRWEAAYAGPAGIVVPPDLAVALAAEPKAQAMYQILTSQNRYAVISRIESLKRADSRAHRVEQYVAMLALGQTIYPQKRTLDG